MGRQRTERPSLKRKPWRPVAFGALALVAAGVATLWWVSGPQGASSGAPRLVVDRTDVDLGYRRFDASVRVAFTLSNAGEGPLRLAEVPRVIVKAGC